MIKKFLAAAATLLLAAGLSVIAVAAPASAHDLDPIASCNSLTVTAKAFDAPNNTTPNNVKVVVDGVQVVDQNFGGSYSKVISLDGTTSHTWSIVIDAPGTQWDKKASGVTTPCYPKRSVSVDCAVIKGISGKALTADDHLNIKVHTLADPTKTFQINASVDLNLGGYQGLGIRFKNSAGVETTVPLTEQQVKTGQLIFNYPSFLGGTTSYVIEWVQFNDTYFNKDNTKAGWLSCDSRTPVTVTAQPSATAPTCDADGSLVIPAQDNITWTGGSNGNGPGTYTLVASTTGNYKLTGPSTFVVKVLAKGSGLSCTVPPVCLERSAVSYTYDPTTNSGVISVVNPNPAKYTNDLCNGFWVTATSWRFTTDQVWPQKRDVVQKLDKIVSVGEYPYSAPVTCGQGDIYASYIAQPDPTEDLFGPSNPFQETFLHNMGFTPDGLVTWVVQTPGCNVVTPVEPTVTKIALCGTYGSIVATDTATITYTITPNNGQTDDTKREGSYTVTAAAIAPAVLKGAKTSWTYDLGKYRECVQASCPATTDGGTSTNLDPNGWDFSETRATGHNDYISGALKVWTEGNTSTDKAAGYHAINVPLAQVGAVSMVTANVVDGAPGIQLGIDRDGDGTFDGYLVQEGTIYGAGNWWTSAAGFGVPAGFGYASVGTLQQYLDANPAAKVVSFGYSLGSGLKGSAEIQSITVGCATYTFNAEVVAPNASYELGVCYPNGSPDSRFSSSNVYITLDNHDSTVPVTFTVVGAKDVTGTDPSLDIVRTIPAGGRIEHIETTPIWDKGGSFTVTFAADGATIPNGTIAIPAFDGCLDGNPGDPAATDQSCVNGQVTLGTITVALQDGFTYTIDGPNGFHKENVEEVTTGLAAGIYKVTVTAKPGYVLTGPNHWPYEITILAPVNCVTLEVPAILTTDISCTVAGNYTLPTIGGVQWFVDGAKVAPGTYVAATASTVNVTAKAITSDYGFANGATEHVFDPLVFTTPVNCVAPSLAGSTSVGVCSANAPWINYDVVLTDPDKQSTSTEAKLTLTDGTNTEVLDLGALVDGKLSGKILWPGATVAADGVTATGWPGWQQDSTGKWNYSAANFGWVRSLTKATISVNPSLEVALSYPPATPNCDPNPPIEPPTLALVTPVVTSTQATCTALGSYTLGSLEPGTVTWSVNGVAGIGNGTYSAKAGTEVTLIATPTKKGDGLDPSFTNPTVLKFAAPSVPCDFQPPTLAYTGLATGAGLTLAGGLVFIGIAGILVARRRAATK